MTEIGLGSVLGFAPHVRLQFDAARSRWFVQAPERLFVPDEVALDVLKLVDGAASVDAIVQALADSYAAPKQEILADIVPLLQDLADKGVLR
jgi:pyrroloquinoline quinone biosynthesis protein D